MKTRIFCMTILIAACTLSGDAKQLKVPQDYASIQAAITAAQKGDTVLVTEGTYYENIRFYGKGIVVASRYHLTRDWKTVFATIIDGSRCTNKDTASTVQFLEKEDSTNVIDGFTITGGTGTKYHFPNGNGATRYQEGAGIILHYSSAVIRNNYIAGNTVTPMAGVNNGGGGGIASMYGKPTIVNNVIASNIAGYAGGVVLNWSGGIVRNNIIIHNTASGPYGSGGIMIWQVPKNSAWVENNTIIANVSLADAGGMCIRLLDAATIPVVRNNVVWSNRQAVGGQITGAQYGSFNNVEDYASGTTISKHPALEAGILKPLPGSPCIDAGDADVQCNDAEDPARNNYAVAPSSGSVKNDIGAYGGKCAAMLPSIPVSDLAVQKTIAAVQCAAGQGGSSAFIVKNFGAMKVVIDSVVQKKGFVFSLARNYAGMSVDVLGSDSIVVRYMPIEIGTDSDTLRLYHSIPGSANPIVLIVNGTATAVTGVGDVGTENHSFLLRQNYPNPFNPSTTITFDLAAGGNVRLTIFDEAGREVRTLVNETKLAGSHSVAWNTLGIPSGVYFCRLRAGVFTQTRKMCVTK